MLIEAGADVNAQNDVHDFLRPLNHHLCSHLATGRRHGIAFCCAIRPCCGGPGAYDQLQRQLDDQEQRRSQFLNFIAFQTLFLAHLFARTGRLASDVAAGAARGMIPE